MDNGSRASAGVKINTKSFKKIELERIQKILNNKYSIPCTIKSAGVDNQYILYFFKKSLPILSSVIKEHMVPSLYYKLNGF